MWVGFVKATAADDGHDEDHVHLVLLSLTADKLQLEFCLPLLMFLVCFLRWSCVWACEECSWDLGCVRSNV